MASINASSHATAAFSCPLALPFFLHWAPKSFKFFDGLQSTNLLSTNGYMADLAFRQLASRSSLAIKRVGKILSADTTSIGNVFPSDNDEFELDRPTEDFASIPEAIEDLRLGKMVVVVDDEDRENEGDLIMAAQLATPEAMAFIVKNGTGIVCVSMKEEDLSRLQLPLMVNQRENEEKLCTAFTVTVDAKHGTTTGVSAIDRATTVLALASKDSKPDDFNSPGHIFPLKYREGGVLKRAGHTEASVDLVVLAGLDPVGVLCEVVDDDDGSMARLPKLCWGNRANSHSNYKLDEQYRTRE